MATYPNGEIPDKALTRTSTGHLLRADAAAAFEALADAFEREFGKPLKVTDAYRPKWGTNGQIEIFEDRYPHPTYQGVNDQRGPWKGKRWWRRKNTAAAAVPGTSNHGWGLALDLGSNVNNLGTREQLWLVANGPRFGWVWPSWARKIPTLEPWHYEFTGTVSFPIGGGTAGSITSPTIPGAPAPIEEEDDTMLVIARTKADPQVWIGDGITRRRIATQDTLKNLQYLAAAGLLRIAKGGAVQTIEDLWALGHPIADDLSTVQTAVATVPSAVWGHRLEHTLAKNPTGKPATVTAGDLLRYEPAEQDATRKVTAELVAAIPGVDPAAVTAAVAQALAGITITVDTKGA